MNACTPNLMQNRPLEEAHAGGLLFDRQNLEGELSSVGGRNFLISQLRSCPAVK